MTYKKLAIVPMLLAVAMIPIAFADHPLTHGFDDHGCFSFYFKETNTYTTNCFWSYEPNEREQEIIEAKKAIQVEDVIEIVDEVVIEVTTPLTLDTSDPRSAMEFYIVKLEAKAELGPLSVADEELLKMLESVHEICYFGVEEGKPIQKFASFIIPTYEPDVETDLGNKWLLNQLFKKQQECSGWEIYKEKWLGQQYLDIETENINRAEIIKEELLKKYPSDFTDPVTFRDLADENERSHGIICQSQLWGNAFKKDSGCLTAEVTVAGTVSFSSQGEAIMAKWQAYLDTGAVEIPTPKEEKTPVTPLDIIKQYMRAYDISPEDLEDGN